jgi:nucleobase:cation symporter-1, NCS1 family
MTTLGTDRELDVFEGRRPAHTGDTTLETQGMAPIPEDARYGRPWRLGPFWFTPNMEISGVFIGTLGVLLGLGFRLGFLAIVIGTVLGSLPVAILCTWGPKTGTAQLPLARMPFGKSVVLPGVVQWLSAIGWLALGTLFGAQAAHLLLHVPFWAGAAIVLLGEGTISILGYELVLQAEKWGAIVMFVLFVVLTSRILTRHIVLPHNTVHGAALAGAFVLMVTIILSAALSWGSYSSDYSRYLPANSSTAAVFGWTMAGLVASYLWVTTVGLAAASVLSDQTAAGIRTLMGGGVLGVLALVAILGAAIVSSSTNDYSASLAFQALGARVKRPVISASVMVLAFLAVLWMNAGNTSGRFENILLFTAYWISPFCAIVMIDWHYRKGSYQPSFLRGALSWHRLASGWPALVAFVVGFGAMVPFMNTSIVVGPVATALKGADIALYVGFVVSGVLYWLLLRIARGRRRSNPEAAAAASGDPGITDRQPTAG